jgi:1-phosphofructokinase family hexose kinase
VAHSPIVTVTLNPALDLTYAVDALVPLQTHRVATVAERPGGKGLNVARVLHSAGEPVLATGLLGGSTGARVAALLRADEVPASFVPIAGETRRTVAVADLAGATGFWEPGPRVTEAEWVAFLDHYTGLLDSAGVVVLSGSLPPGVPTDAYATLIRLAAGRETRTVLDTSGEALRHGLAAGPDLVKPNAEELAALLGDTAGDDLADAVRMRKHGARAVVVSHGPRGLLAVSGEGAWRGVPPERLAGNATGAGDACVAALARGLRDESSWPQRLADAVALSAAAVASPVAGAVDPETYRRTLPGVTVTVVQKGSDVYTDR